MKLFKKFFPVVLGLLLLSGTAFAQGMQMNTAKADTVTDEELKSFIDATKEVQLEMQNMIKEEGMEVQRFQTIMQSQQNPQAAGNVEVTDEEQEIIDKIQPKLQQMGQQAQQEQVSVIEDNDLTMQRYQQIAQTIQSNPAMMQKAQKMMTDSTSNGDGN